MKRRADILELSEVTRQRLHLLANVANRRLWNRHFREDPGCSARQCIHEGCSPKDCHLHQGMKDGRPYPGIVPIEGAITRIQSELVKIQWLKSPGKRQSPSQWLKEVSQYANAMQRAAKYAPELAEKAQGAKALARKVSAAVKAAPRGRPLGMKRPRLDGLSSRLAVAIAGHLKGAGLAVHVGATSEPEAFQIIVEIVQALFPETEAETIRNAINR